MSEEADHERRTAEIALMEAMYPGEVSFDPHSSEFRFSNPDSFLSLRLQDDYPSRAVPSVLSAQLKTRRRKDDLRERAREAISSLHPGEELLDVMITQFNDIVARHRDSCAAVPERLENENENENDERRQGKVTVVVYLHHLLSTAKRKRILAPLSPHVSGVSKVGYPGVLVFSGPAAGVRSHVGELRGLNWQAFQVRLEEEEEEEEEEKGAGSGGQASERDGTGEWAFAHGKGIKEVETMGEAVAEIVGEKQKAAFMEAMKIR